MVKAPMPSTSPLPAMIESDPVAATEEPAIRLTLSPASSVMDAPGPVVLTVTPR
jgi:hypothetical protein